MVFSYELVSFRKKMSEEKIYEIELSSKYRKVLQKYSEGNAKIIYWKAFNSSIVLATDLGYITRIQGYPVSTKFHLSREEFIALVNNIETCFGVVRQQQPIFRVLHQSTKKWKKTRQRLVCYSTDNGGYCITREDAKARPVNENAVVNVQANRPVDEEDDGVSWEERFEKFFIAPTDNAYKMGKLMRQWLEENQSVIYADDHEKLLATLQPPSSLGPLQPLAQKGKGKRTGVATSTTTKPTKIPKMSGNQKKRRQIEVDALVVLFEFYRYKKCATFQETCMRYSEEMLLELRTTFEHEKCDVDFIYDIFKKIGEPQLHYLFERFTLRRHSFLQSDPEQTDDECEDGDKEEGQTIVVG